MRFEVLGPVRGFGDGQELALGGRQQRLVLALLIAAGGRVVPVLVHDVMELPTELPAMLHDGDLVLLLGAGNIGQVAKQLRNRGFELPEVHGAG